MCRWQRYTCCTWTEAYLTDSVSASSCRHHARDDLFWSRDSDRCASIAAGSHFDFVQVTYNCLSTAYRIYTQCALITTVQSLCLLLLWRRMRSTQWIDWIEWDNGASRWCLLLYVLRNTSKYSGRSRLVQYHPRDHHLASSIAIVNRDVTICMTCAVTQRV